MQIDDKLVLHVAKLAHLRLAPDQVAHYKVQLGKILGHIDQLKELENINVEDFESDLSTTTERQDTVVVANILDAAMEQSPDHIGTAFQVPRIIE